MSLIDAKDDDEPECMKAVYSRQLLLLRRRLKVIENRVLRRDEELQSLGREMTIEGDFSFNQFSNPVCQVGNQNGNLKLLMFEDISHRLFKLKKPRGDKKASIGNSEYNLKKKFARVFFKNYILAGDNPLPSKIILSDFFRFRGNLEFYQKK